VRPSVFRALTVVGRTPNGAPTVGRPKRGSTGKHAVVKAGEKAACRAKDFVLRFGKIHKSPGLKLKLHSSGSLLGRASFWLGGCFGEHGLLCVSSSR